MFATGPRGHLAHYYYVFIVVIVVVFISGSGRFVVGRPQNSQDNDSPRAEEEEAQHRDSASPPAQSALRFSPELLMEPPSLDRSSNNVSPVPPVFPYHQPYPPSQPPASNANSNNNNPTFPQHDHQNKNADDDQDLNDVPPFSGDGPRGEFFGQDLDGPEETWDKDPDVVDSEVPPPTAQQPRWPGSDRPTTLNQREDIKVVVVPPVVVEDDLNVDRFHGNLLGGFREEDANEDLDVPELRLKTRDPEPLPSAARSAGYVPAPHRVFAGAQGSIVSSPAELTARDVDVDGPPVPNPHVAMPDDVPADPRKIVPWPEMLQRDVDVDGPIRYGAASSPSSSSLPDERSEPPTHPAVDDAELQQWKKLALGDLDNMDGDRAPANGDDYEPVTDIDVDYEHVRNPFEDEEEEEEEENEVPEELVRQVIEAMQAPAPAWLRQESLTAGAASLELEAPHDDDEEEEEEEGFWIAITDDDYDDDEDDDSDYDEYMDWVLTHEQSDPGFRVNSRLITLIFETIGAPDEMLDEDEDEDGEEEMSSVDAYEKELSIWQVLTNFPFPMLLGHSDQFGGSLTVDYSYDDDDDDDYYDDEEYYDDDYYDDEYDDEEYEDYGDYEDEEKEEGEDESDELDDYFYSETYDDDCEDCVEDDDVTTVKKQEMTILSLPSMLAR